MVIGIVSSLRNICIAHDMFVFGEVGLSGEIRPVANGEIRIKEALKHGFNKAIVPKSNRPKRTVAGVEIIGVAHLSEALAAL